MHVVVIGCGKVGSKLAHVLADEGHDVVIVDNDSNSFKALEPGFNGITVAGVPIDQDVLKRAGIETADALTAVTPDDNVNVMVSQVAKEIFKVPRVIARIYNPAREHVFHEFGLETICPTDMTVDVIRSKVLGDKSFERHMIADTNFIFSYQKVSKSEDGKKLSTIKIDAGTFVFGIMRNKEFMISDPEIKLQKEDTLIIAQKGEPRKCI